MEKNKKFKGLRWDRNFMRIVKLTTVRCYMQRGDKLPCRSLIENHPNYLNN